MTEKLFSVVHGLFPDDVDYVLQRWNKFDGRLSTWPNSDLSGIYPVACHSHNDYWQDVPLYNALKSGCSSIEADAWLLDSEIYVGHTPAELTNDRTLRNLYLDPLLQMTERSNSVRDARSSSVFTQRKELSGIYPSDPTRSLVLVIDFKTAGGALWTELNAQLEPHRSAGFLSHHNGKRMIHGPITVVLSGNVPFDLITANKTYRDVFYDAPLEKIADTSAIWPNPNKPSGNELGLYQSNETVETSDVLASDQIEPYDSTNSYFASTNFKRSVGYVWGSRLSQSQLQTIRSQVRGAHARGLKARYWDTPMWPIGLRNHIWHILMREGVDILSVDDLRGATRTDWRRKKGWHF